MLIDTSLPGALHVALGLDPSPRANLELSINPVDEMDGVLLGNRKGSIGPVNEVVEELMSITVVPELLKSTTGVVNELMFTQPLLTDAIIVLPVTMSV